MKLEEIFLLGNVNSGLQIDVSEFFDLCLNLESLTDDENNDLMTEYTIKNHRITYKKIVILERFEEMLELFAKKIQAEAPNNIALQTFLIETIKRIQEKLKINTSLHLNMIASSPRIERKDRATCH